MSSIVGEHARVTQAFDAPTLSLLRGSLSPATVAILRTGFPRDTKTQPTARLHQLVDGLLRELRESGLPHVPDGDGRDVCMAWVRRNWLTRDTDGTTYTLTSHAMQALGLVQSLTRDRVNLSEHRIKNLVDTASRVSSAANPDRDARMQLLRDQIAERQVELDRLAAGGDMPEVSADFILEGLVELQDLVSGLPVEFARVGEVVDALQDKLRQDFRADARSPGEIVADYLIRAAELTTTTAEGRAFDGAFTLLGDDAVLDKLRTDITSLVEHPDVSAVLTSAEKKALVGIVRLVRDGARGTMAKIVDTVETLNTFIRSRNVAEDRELDTVLWHLEAALTGWMQSAGPRATAPVHLLPDALEIVALKEGFHDPANDIPLDPLEDDPLDQPDAMSLDELRQFGGPHLEELRDALDEALGTGAAGWTIAGQLLPRLPDDMRRPVDALGLLHLVTERDDLARTGAVERYVTRRPDGTERVLLMPVVTPAHRKVDGDDEH